VPNAETIAAMQEARKGKLKSAKLEQDLMVNLNGDD
jgi:hypothetical protein